MRSLLEFHIVEGNSLGTRHCNDALSFELKKEHQE